MSVQVESPKKPIKSAQVYKHCNASSSSSSPTPECASTPHETHLFGKNSFPPTLPLLNEEFPKVVINADLQDQDFNASDQNLDTYNPLGFFLNSQPEQRKQSQAKKQA